MCCAQRCTDTCYMYDLICGWWDVLFLTKFYLKSIRCVILIYTVGDDYELSKFSISLCRKEYHGLVGFMEIKLKKKKNNVCANVNLCNECNENSY